MHRFVSAAAVLCALGLAHPSLTAAQAPPLGDFSVLRFSPAPGANNYSSVDGARVHGGLDGSAGIVLDYAHNPLSLYPATCTGPDDTGCAIQPGTPPTRVVEYTAAAHIWGSIALFDRLQISLVLPLAITRGDAFIFGMGPAGMLPGINDPQFVLADPRLHVKVNALDDHESGFRLGFVAFVTAPTGHAIAPRRFVGDEDPTFGGHVVAELVTSGFHLAANVGGIWRDGDTLFSTEALGQFTYALAVGYEITPLIDIFAEVIGATTFRSAVDENPLEARLNARMRVDDVVFSLGGGPGLVAGVGSPAFRMIGGFMWAPLVVDEDGDGINDEQDSCPADAEDIDDHDDLDGCPEADNDGDGLVDLEDTCPNDAEDMDGVDDTDGCPDEDTDGDGIQDGYDSCVNEPEDMDDDRDDDGCPDYDRDRDNINDDVDACPGEPEDTDGFGDEDGCPEVDFDGDGLSDEDDQCPDVAEDMDSFEDEDGCAEEGAPPAEHHGHGHH